MKNIKQYESFRTEQVIIDLCSKYGIEDYQIRDDGSIDVGGDVNLSWGKLEDLKQLPLTFNEVNRNFICGSNKLTTLVSKAFLKRLVVLIVDIHPSTPSIIHSSKNVTMIR
jgi:hypothetical protein